MLNESLHWFVAAWLKRLREAQSGQRQERGLEPSGRLGATYQPAHHAWSAASWNHCQLSCSP